MRRPGSQKALEHRRFRAIELLGQGHSLKEVARLLGVDRRNVVRWKAAYRERGPEGLRLKPMPGRVPKLSESRRGQRVEILLQGAQAAGYPTDLWTCPRIAHVIFERFGVGYHVDHIGRLLRSLRWSPQKPTRKAIERNEEQIRHWIETDWKTLKKKPAA